MNTPLKYIQNWVERAEEANWHVSLLAKKCDVSVRTLERYLKKETGKSPKAWLLEQRQLIAREKLKEGLSVKEAASALGYKHSNNFSRSFKEFWGRCPTGAAPIGEEEDSSVAK